MMIGDVCPTTGEFMLSDAQAIRLAAGLRDGDGAPVDVDTAVEFFLDALLRAGLLHGDRAVGFYKARSAVALDADGWNRAVHRALVEHGRRV